MSRLVDRVALVLTALGMACGLGLLALWYTDAFGDVLGKMVLVHHVLLALGVIGLITRAMGPKRLKAADENAQWLAGTRQRALQPGPLAQLFLVLVGVGLLIIAGTELWLWLLKWWVPTPGATMQSIQFRAG